MSRNAFPQCEREYIEAMATIDIAREESRRMKQAARA